MIVLRSGKAKRTRHSLANAVFMSEVFGPVLRCGSYNSPMSTVRREEAAIRRFLQICIESASFSPAAAVSYQPSTEARGNA
jgi:hypothetical protein